jgi:trehalose-6-phosphate hydrolase
MVSKSPDRGEKIHGLLHLSKMETNEVPPTNWKSKFGGSAWEYVPHLKKWYLHLFDKTQADLNWDNKEVREELKKVIRFWKNKGIKGFRFDVVNLISKPANFQNDETGDGRRFYTDGPHVHEYLKELVADTGMEDMITVGEMSSTSLDNCILYSNPSEKELSMTFHFHHLKVDYKDENKWEIQETDYRKLKKIFKSWQEGMQEGNGWNALFWCNHDQPRSVSRFGNDKLYWKESAKMLATCIHCMRGTPYIYQGEEIGITSGHFTDIHQYKDVESKNYYDIMRKAGKSHEEAIKILQARSRDNGRTPMQWSNEPYAGFSTAKPWIDVPKNYEYINVKIEESDQDSILQYYKELIKLRKNETLIADGEIKFILDDCEDVLAYKRFSNEEEILVLNNLKEKEVVLDLSKDLSKYKKLLGNYDGIILENTKIKLRPYESIVAKLSATI